MDIKSSLRKYNHNRTPVNLLKLQKACKTYKNTMNTFINRHNKNNEEKLRNMHRKQPKDYWKLLNSIKNKNAKETPSINTFYDHFQECNLPDDDSEDTFVSNNIDMSTNNAFLNSPITASEIEKCISLLKSSKSPGIDNILNEYIKSTKHILTPIYVQLFNIVLNTGIIPTAWVEGIIIPLYKNKGDALDVNNYRPITLLSCLGKLFTAILNDRLSTFLEDSCILHENQAGFRQSYSTIDHIFALNSITELLRYQKKKIYCTFIDFSKAFDSVWRIGLWRKLLDSQIDGKFLTVIQNLYLNIKSCVTVNGERSPFFGSYRGVRQGENLSPVLFSLFLNDLEVFLQSKNNNGIEIEAINDDTYVFIQILTLLYADDTVIIAQDPASLQKSLDDFYEYCTKWKLNINAEKSKTIIFGSRSKKTPQFKIGSNVVEIVDHYKYLGIYFSKSGSFLYARKHIAEQARKALHLLYMRINNLHLPVDLQLKLFVNTVLPILTYGCEVFGYENLEMLERIHTSFLRKITKTRKSTPLYALYAELGRYPIQLTVKCRMISFWNRIITGKQTKITYHLYTALRATPNFESKWINHIKGILNEAGRPDIWHAQSDISSNNISKIIKAHLIDQNTQNWHSSLQNSSKGRNYEAIKDNIVLEPYFLKLQPNHYIPLVKFRTGNHRFPVEIYRWEGIPLSERKCTLCNSNDIGDEYQYLLKCNFFADSRRQYIHKYYYTRSNMLKYKELLSLTSPAKLIKLSSFIRILLYFSRRTS